MFKEPGSREDPLMLIALGFRRTVGLDGQDRVGGLIFRMISKASTMYHIELVLDPRLIPHWFIC